MSYPPRSVMPFSAAARMARISACAVGSPSWATWLTASTTISPSFTMRHANGLPPSRTFSRARDTVRAVSS